MINNTGGALEPNNEELAPLQLQSGEHHRCLPADYPNGGEIINLRILACHRLTQASSTGMAAGNLERQYHRSWMYYATHLPRAHTNQLFVNTPAASLADFISAYDGMSAGTVLARCGDTCGTCGDWLTNSDCNEL